MKGQGWTGALSSYPVKEGSDILTSSLAAFLFSSHPKMERDGEAHVNYYTSVYNRERQLSHRKTKLNQIQQTNRQTDGQVTAYSEREREFRFAKVWKHITMHCCQIRTEP